MTSGATRCSIDRRTLLRGAAASMALLATSCISAPMPVKRMPRIGVLTAESLMPDGSQPEQELDIAEGLRLEGLVDGTSATIVWKRTQGDPKEFPRLARELVNLPADVVIAATTSAAIAVKEQSSTIPIVMEGAGDPLGRGIIDTYARPGGNVTGTAFSNRQEAGKRLELLHDVVPGMRRAIVLGFYAPDNQSNDDFAAELYNAAAPMGIELATPAMEDEKALDAILASARTGDALVSIGTSIIFKNYKRIAAVGLARRLPTAFTRVEHVKAGGLLSYGSNRREARLGAAKFVRRILDGESPATLPVLLSTQYDVGLNLATANALGLTFPPSVMAQATDVVQ